MIRHIVTVFLVLSSNILYAQAYRTQAISPEIHTIQVNIANNPSINPIIALNGGDVVNISFDRISDNSYNRLRYRVLHCDAYWNKSASISDVDYLKGFNDSPIEDYTPSLNTTVEYTHFSLDIPNRDVDLKLSGNYVVEVYDESEPKETLLTACFSIVESKINISASVSSNTDIDTNRNHQQLSFIIHYKGVSVRDPLAELSVFVQQNNRLDSERKKLKPTYINPDKLIYEHNKDLIFEAGNEYRRFETSSHRYNGMNVAHIEYRRPDYIMDIVTDKVKVSGYSYDQDQNGRYYIRTNESDQPETEADYFITNFTLAMDEPINESIYINGSFTDNTFSSKYKMQYEDSSNTYRLSILLKQGLYNYQYLVQNGNKLSTSKIEGNYYETENEYSIYVYHRPTGQRYDALIGVQNIQSREK